MKRTAAVACIGAGIFLLSSCSQSDQDQARARAERLKERTKEGAQKLADKTKEAAAAISGKTKSAVEDNRPMAESAEVKLRRGAARAGQEIKEGTITAKVKAHLANDVGLKSVTALSVETSGHTVTLRGHVASAERRRDVENATLLVEGVTKVNNELTVQ